MNSIANSLHHYLCACAATHGPCSPALPALSCPCSVLPCLLSLAPTSLYFALPCCPALGHAKKTKAKPLPKTLILSLLSAEAILAGTAWLQSNCTNTCT